MIKIYFISFLFFSLLPQQLFAHELNAVPPEVLEILSNTNEGRRALREIKNESYGSVDVRFVKMSKEYLGEISVNSDGSYIIKVASHSSSYGSIAQTIVHEFQHIRDLHTVGSTVINGSSAAEILLKTRRHRTPEGDRLYGSYILCFELQGYGASQVLEKEGVKASETLKGAFEYITKTQLKDMGILLSKNEIAQVTMSCADSNSFQDFLKNLIGQKASTSWDSRKPLELVPLNRRLSNRDFADVRLIGVECRNTTPNWTKLELLEIKIFAD